MQFWTQEPKLEPPVWKYGNLGFRQFYYIHEQSFDFGIANTQGQFSALVCRCPIHHENNENLPM